ncbi:serum response factor homolog isoform X1 [Sitophilus oryzae]|uniref:Serum response factor homolog n=1 Tax=Sitophilus oryzae TaxID=7048 RepID=A0A6J2Y9C2_SITOR|nr:serum response factor homolog isoform X1 [Sitophilus oryzae]
MEPPGGRDSRFNLGYNMNLLSGETPPEIYGSSLGRPSTSLQQLSPRHTMVSSACGTRGSLSKSDVCYDDRGMTTGGQQGIGLEACGVNDIDEPYGSMQAKKSPPSNGKKTKGRVKIKMEYIENKLRRYTTFSKRKTGIMKKAYELSTLTGTQVMLLVASETGHVYTFATRKLQPMITSEAGKALIQTCLNSPDPPAGAGSGDQRMSATGFEETELTYNISDEDSKENECDSNSGEEDDDISEEEVICEPPVKVFKSDSSESTSEPPAPSKDPAQSKEPSREKEDQSPIISQIKKINNALIMSNKAAVSGTTSKEIVKTPPPASTTATTSPISNIQAVPLIVQTANGVGFASVSEGMILGMVQGSTEPKFIALPISSLAGGTITSAPSNSAVKDDNVR